MKSNPVEIAVKKAGSQAAIADALGIRPQNVYFWKIRGRIPDRHIQAVAKLTGLSVKQLAG